MPDVEPLSDTRFEAWYLRRIEDGTLGNSEGGSFGMDMIALAFRDAGDEARERVRVLEEFRAAFQIRQESHSHPQKFFPHRPGVKYPTAEQ